MCGGTWGILSCSCQLSELRGCTWEGMARPGTDQECMEEGWQLQKRASGGRGGPQGQWTQEPETLLHPGLAHSPRTPVITSAKAVSQAWLEALCCSQPLRAWSWVPSQAMTPQGHPAHLRFDLCLGPGSGPLQTLLLQLLLHLGLLFPDSGWQWQHKMG